MSPFSRLPIELIIAIAASLDGRSLAYFKSTCKAFQSVVSQTPSLQYALALAARGLCDGPPSSVTVTSRLELVEAYDEAWRTLSWTKHLTIPEYCLHNAPHISGGTIVLPIGRLGIHIRSFVVYSIPSPLRGVPERRWRIDLDFIIMCFVVDASQDLFILIPKHDRTSVLTHALSTGQPHPLAANRGVLRMKASIYPSLGINKQQICGDFFGTTASMTQSEPAGLDRVLLIWNWKTGVLHVNMPIIVHCSDDAVFSFLDDHHFVIPCVGHNSIDLNVFRLCPYPDPQHEWQQAQVPLAIMVRSYTLSLSEVVKRIHTVQFFEDVSACGGAPFPPGHFYADPSKRAFCIQFRGLSCWPTPFQELVVPIQALSGPTRELSYRYSGCTGVFDEHSVDLPIQHAFRAATAVGCMSIAPEKLPPALRAVDPSWLRYIVCYGALLVFEYYEGPWISRRLHILAF